MNQEGRQGHPLWVPTRQEGTHNGCPYTRNMLTESEQLLISAAVDGELTPAEAKAFERLVMSDPEASRLFRRLKEASARLAALPKHTAPKGLAAKVMARVRPVAPHRAPARGRALLPVAIAASLFLAVTAGSFFFFRDSTGNNNEQAQQNQLPPPGPSAVMPDVPVGDLVASAKTGAGEDGIVKPATDDGAFTKMPPVEAEPVVVVRVPKPLTPEEKELLTSALMIEPTTLKQINPTLPLILSALEFDKEEPQTRLKKELAKDAGFRLNLFSKNTVAAVEHLQAAARHVGVHVFTEGLTARRIKEPLALPYAVYIENLTADELAALLAALTKIVNEQSRPETILGSAHLVTADVPEHKDLKELIGLDWPQAKAGKPTDGKAVSESTLKEVVASVKKSGEKAAVVVTYAAKQNAGKSPEVKQFLEKRGDRKPGAVPLLVVIRPQG